MSRIEKILEYLKASPQGDSFLEHALALEYIKIGEEGKGTRRGESNQRAVVVLHVVV